MITKKCDVCGDEADYLHTLTAEYKQECDEYSISEVCDTCVKKINDLLDSCRNAQVIQRTNFVRRFIKNLVNKKA